MASKTWNDILAAAIKTNTIEECKRRSQEANKETERQQAEKSQKEIKLFNKVWGVISQVPPMTDFEYECLCEGYGIVKYKGHYVVVVRTPFWDHPKTLLEVSLLDDDETPYERRMMDFWDNDKRIIRELADIISERVAYIDEKIAKAEKRRAKRKAA